MQSHRQYQDELKNLKTNNPQNIHVNYWKVFQISDPIFQRMVFPVKNILNKFFTSTKKTKFLEVCRSLFFCLFTKTKI